MSFSFFSFFELRRKKKYLANRVSKSRSVFRNRLVASRSSKLDPILICFDKLFFALPDVSMLYCLSCTPSDGHILAFFMIHCHIFCGVLPRQCTTKLRQCIVKQKAVHCSSRQCTTNLRQCTVKEKAVHCSSRQLLLIRGSAP